MPFRIEVKKILPKQEHKKQLSMKDGDSDFGNDMAMEYGGSGDGGL